MKTILTFYRTWSYGGMEGRTLEKRDFISIEDAKQNALNDTWNDSFALYEISLMVYDKGEIKEISYKLEEKIPCGRDLIKEKKTKIR